MATRDVFLDNIKVSSWDDTLRSVTFYNANGTVNSTRAYTAEENTATDARIAETTAETNAATLTAKAKTALTNNNTFLAIASPTNTDIVAQVKALTRQVNALIKLEIQDLANTTGT